MSDRGIVRKQSASIGQFAMVVPYVKGIEQLIFHAVVCPYLVPFP